MRGAQAASAVSLWHQARRSAILKLHPEVAALEGRADGRLIPVLGLTCLAHLALACGSAQLPWLGVLALACGPGSILSLW
jgi:hypothetical protein